MYFENCKYALHLNLFSCILESGLLLAWASYRVGLYLSVLFNCLSTQQMFALSHPPGSKHWRYTREQDTVLPGGSVLCRGHRHVFLPFFNFLFYPYSPLLFQFFSNSFIDTQFTQHTSHPFKIHSAVGFISLYLRSCAPITSVNFRTSHQPKRNPVHCQSLTVFPQPLRPRHS